MAIIVNLDVMMAKRKISSQELAEKAHAFCPYSKATRNNIDVEVKAVEYK